ncbi:uncharacterized protein STEHIDRAFT_115151 [Stereum hirsutum FP-91666 SS1]|uniref:uncharacterized protein n=1 Tax=Stereum hirsutum (strain FP-91666) TaxID=721885 RepID=UPI000444A10A|nr:uncharacterized protein STEHIDRAFT_115151 [Stereum hirsutum FP-91666 SS1]EIM80944.1 hypothetical protein STEHIDRAFT_115151 [Stereum hirsutum FP-91666 SS1]
MEEISRFTTVQKSSYADCTQEYLQALREEKNAREKHSRCFFPRGGGPVCPASWPAYSVLELTLIYDQLTTGTSKDVQTSERTRESAKATSDIKVIMTMSMADIFQRMEFGVRKNHGSKMQLRKGESSAAKLRLITILRTIVPLHMLSSFILCCTSAGEHGCSFNDPSRMLRAIHGANTDIQVLLSSLQAAHEYEMAISDDINHSKSMIVNISKFNPLPYSNAHSPPMGLTAATEPSHNLHDWILLLSMTKATTKNGGENEERRYDLELERNQKYEQKHDPSLSRTAAPRYQEARVRTNHALMHAGMYACMLMSAVIGELD